MFPVKVVIVNRGGTQMKVIKTLAHHIPPIIIGHLDDKGVDLLDEMLDGPDMIDEVVDFFEEYKPVGPLRLKFKKRLQDGDEPEEELEDDDEPEVELELEIDTSENEDYSSDYDEESKEVEKQPSKLNIKKEKKLEEPRDEKEKEKFDLNDKDYQKIPYMHPETRTCSFDYFFAKVEKISQKKDLVEEQALDVMELKMGGSYRTDIVDLRSQQQNKDKIEEHFLMIDAKEEKERQMKAKLEAMKKRVKNSQIKT